MEPVLRRFLTRSRVWGLNRSIIRQCLWEVATADRGLRIPENVPFLRANHIKVQSIVLRVWGAAQSVLARGGTAQDFKRGS
jgi:hypothetical protein